MASDEEGESSSCSQTVVNTRSLIASCVNNIIFENEQEKVRFEDIFREYSVYRDGVTFQYLKSFQRVRINYPTVDEAVRVLQELHGRLICGKNIRLQMLKMLIHTRADPHLEPPPLTKQFLISPPASPPVDWEPAAEATPIINYELLAALAKLSPGDSHELHPAQDNKPRILLHPCPDNQAQKGGPKPQIIQTKCPERR